MKEKSLSRQIAEKVIFTVFEILNKETEGLPKREILNRIRETVSFDEYANEFLEKSGTTRWETILNFYSINCTKAGFLIKESGTWYLTEEGKAAMNLGAEGLLQKIIEKYNEWKPSVEKEKDLIVADNTSDIELEYDLQAQASFLEGYRTKALVAIEGFVRKMNPYVFQNLVAALLRAMGYHIAEVAKEGKDGGIDIIAYTDPLGVKVPRIIVQVKRYQGTKITAPDIQQLLGTLKRNSDVGIFVTSSSFTSEAKKEARNAGKHVELIDFGKFIELLVKYYNNLSIEDKKLLPLCPIYFLGTNE